MNPWIFSRGAILAEVTGAGALRASAGFSRLWSSIVGIASYGSALKAIPRGAAYAVWAGIVFVAAIDWPVFEQKLDAPATVGIGLIIAGMLTLNVFSTTGAH